MYIANNTSDCLHERPSCVSLDDLGNVSILLHKYNDLEEEITNLFYFQVWKKNHNQSGCKYTENMHRNVV